MLDSDSVSVVQDELNGRRLQVASGKGTGGGSSINACMWVRGGGRLFDSWVEAGATGWDSRTMEDLFVDMEAGRFGAKPMTIQPAAKGNWAAEAFVQACVDTGTVGETGDYNARFQPDHGIAAITNQNVTEDGRRCDAFSTFVGATPADRPANLVVLTNATVHRIVIDAESKEATGVVVNVQGSGAQFLRARREVVLSAGALDSPKLLMLSGVGPREELEKHGIEVVHEVLGVGASFQDHALCNVSVFVDREVGDRSGSGLNATAFYRSSYAAEHEPNEPLDMQLVGIPGLPITHVLPYLVLDRFVRLPSATCSDKTTVQGQLYRFALSTIMWAVNAFSLDNKWMGPIRKMYAIGVVCNRPTQRGRIRLASRDPEARPVIDFQWLGVPDQMDRMVEGVKKAIAVLEKAFVVTNWGLVGYDQLRTGGDEAIRAFLRTTATHAWHPAGSLRMGAASDETAVCDPQGRVRGVGNLRVADASLMPVVTNGNTNASSMVIGYKVAQHMAEELGA
jgi:choline dehydrogenase-like flavoprotein